MPQCSAVGAQQLHHPNVNSLAVPLEAKRCLRELTARSQQQRAARLPRYGPPGQQHSHRKTAAEEAVDVQQVRAHIAEDPAASPYPAMTDARIEHVRVADASPYIGCHVGIRLPVT